MREFNLLGGLFRYGSTDSRPRQIFANLKTAFEEEFKAPTSLQNTAGSPARKDRAQARGYRSQSRDSGKHGLARGR